MDIFLGVIIGLVVLMILVTAHEFGHFLMAKRNGVKVVEFGIGFPPKAIAWVKDPKTKKWKKLKKSEWKKTQKGLIFSLNWLPVGGFCQMDGESAEDERKGTFGNAGYWQKTKILFGGVVANWLVAFLILTILAWTGMPKFLENQFTIASDTKVSQSRVGINIVAKDSPAEKAGLASGDLILAIDYNDFWEADKITEYNTQHAGEEVVYTIERKISTCENEECKDEIQKKDLLVTLNTKDAEYLLGVTMSMSQSFNYSTWSAPIVGAGLTLQLTGETFKGLGQMLWNLVAGVGSQFSFDASVRDSGRETISEVGDSVSGPVGIIGSIFPAFASSGIANLAFLTALISVSLACMNVLPIPALDGGRWLLITIYKIRKKKLTKELEEKIIARAFLVLLTLMAIVTILDILRFIR